MFEVALQLWRQNLKSHTTHSIAYLKSAPQAWYKQSLVACDNPRRQHMGGEELKENQEIKVSWRQEGH